MDYEPVTRRSDLIGIVSVVGVFCVVALFASLERALVLSVAFGVLQSIVQTQPVEHRDQRFWLLIGALALGHLVVLTLVPLEEFKYGLVVLPFAFADGFAIRALVKWSEKRVRRD